MTIFKTFSRSLVDVKVKNFMELEKHKNITNSLYNLAQQTLTVSLLKLRSNTVNSSRDSLKSSTFLFPELVERIKSCKGVEVVHLISALPHSGLRPDLLEVLESYHPVIE